MASNYKLKYNVDLVFCIDATGSMDGLLEKVKQGAISFYDDLKETMTKKGKNVNTLRIRIIAFRDYVADSAADAMLSTDFFVLPDQKVEFSNTIKSIEAFGGGDEPEDGLEALGFAIRSDWNTEPGTKKRQVIVVWTDAPTHDIGYGSSVKGYPTKMAKSFGELTEWWGDRQNNGYMDYDSKRLLLFAPNQPGWSTISDNWEGVIHFPSEAGNGLDEYTYEQILNVIANTIAGVGA